MASIFPLKNEIMPYAWGSTTAIATLLGHPSPSTTPQAELWMGSHPKAPSLIQVGEDWISLMDGIEKNPSFMLGSAVASRYGKQLPYLFKVLAVEFPLSIQVHPNKAQAEKGFELEDAQGIPIDAAYRNYRDVNHKPECICALTPFWALNGFRSIDDFIDRLQAACRETLGPEIKLIIEGTPNPSILKSIFKRLMTLSPQHKKEVVREALTFAQAQKTTEPTWGWMLKLARYYPNDIGILSPLILNLICLSPGQAMYLPAGRIHAYLEGTGLELMANSDNVLRGGLTPKHIDIDELCNILRFEPAMINPMKPRHLTPCEEKYDTPAVEFSLGKVTLDGKRSHTSTTESGAQIVLCVDGAVVITELKTGEIVEIKKGQSVFVAGDSVGYRVAGRGIYYAATVPL